MAISSFLALAALRSFRSLLRSASGDGTEFFFATGFLDALDIMISEELFFGDAV